MAQTPAEKTLNPRPPAKSRAEPTGWPEEKNEGTAESEATDGSNGRGNASNEDEESVARRNVAIETFNFVVDGALLASAAVPVLGDFFDVIAHIKAQCENLLGRVDEANEVLTLAKDDIKLLEEIEKKFKKRADTGSNGRVAQALVQAAIKLNGCIRQLEEEAKLILASDGGCCSARARQLCRGAIYKRNFESAKEAVADARKKFSQALAVDTNEIARDNKAELAKLVLWQARLTKQMEEVFRVKRDPGREKSERLDESRLERAERRVESQKEEIHALRRMVCGGWLATWRMMCEMGEDPVPWRSLEDDLEDEENYELFISGWARVDPAALAERFAADISALDAATAQLAGGAAPDTEAAPYASALAETLLQMERASGCLRSLAAIEVAQWTPAQLREQLDAAYGRLEDMSSRRGSVTRRATPTRRTSWVSVWKCDAFRHRDELADAATGERHEPDVVGERLDASSLSPDDAAAAQAFA